MLDSIKGLQHSSSADVKYSWPPSAPVLNSAQDAPLTAPSFRPNLADHHPYAVDLLTDLEVFSSKTSCRVGTFLKMWHPSLHSLPAPP